MRIFEVKADRWVYRDLLLLADPSEEMVGRYLSRGFMLAAQVDGRAVGEIVVTPQAQGWEIKNLAVDENFWRRGIGRALIEAATGRLPAGTELFVGTADGVPGGVDFYERCGFCRSHLVKNFFVDNYPEPVYDSGVQCVDMVYLKRRCGG
ncbi:MULTISPECIES: GNAT family N-acetyltransferase [Anaerotruncus]|jgi:ribosomal protein S18 acetylase RimI-like enzyme|uniref:GNAT family N-acetyltransferase n=1 Tax=Anaerotruncus TaxID=244127 RepID=UPI00082E2DBB|nr:MULTISPECIES: GNAT family N-acetyltransferase [Anaerotruncus]RGX56995.1 GNAT family N-acetyltransferase [Anaerotruncus sp. AF02-27]